MTLAVVGRRRHRSADRVRAARHLGNSPWLATDLVRVGCWVAVGVVVDVIAWYGASGSTLWSTQTGWIVLGILAAIIVSVGCVGWLLAGLRSVGAARSEALHGLRTPTPVAVSMPAFADYVAGLRMTRFHRHGCRLIAGKDVGILGLGEIATRSLQACGVCQPGVLQP